MNNIWIPAYKILANTVFLDITSFTYDLDTFFMIPCLEGYTISDIFANELYDEKSLYIF